MLNEEGKEVRDFPQFVLIGLWCLKPKLSLSVISAVRLTVKKNRMPVIVALSVAQ